MSKAEVTDRIFSIVYFNTCYYQVFYVEIISVTLEPKKNRGRAV